MSACFALRAVEVALHDLFVTINHWLFLAIRHRKHIVATRPAARIVAVKAAAIVEGATDMLGLFLFDARFSLHGRPRTT